MASGATHCAHQVVVALGWAAGDERLPPLLSHSDQAWIRRLVRAEDRSNTCMSRALVRLALRDAMAAPECLLPFVPVGRTDGKKPYLSGDRCERFCGRTVNASHHAGLVACAHCDTAVAAVDVMRFEPRPGVSCDEEFFALMEEYFTDREWASIRAGVEPDAERVELRREGPGRADAAGGVSGPMRSFYWHWVGKEAAVKAMGLGLVVPLRRIEVRFAGAGKGVGGGEQAQGAKSAVDAARSETSGRAAAAAADGDGAERAAVELWLDGERAAAWSLVPLLVAGSFPAMVAAAPRSAAAEPLADGECEAMWPPPAKDADEAVRRGLGGSAVGSADVTVVGVTADDIVRSGSARRGGDWPTGGASRAVSQ